MSSSSASTMAVEQLVQMDLNVCCSWHVSLATRPG